MREIKIYRDSTVEEVNLILDKVLKSNLNKQEKIEILNNCLSIAFSFHEREDLKRTVVKKIGQFRKTIKEDQLRERPELNVDSYAELTFNDKVKYWSGKLHKQMRWQVESGLNPYAIYTPEWYRSTKQFEPNFDAIMEEVIEKYWGIGAGWSKEEYKARIES